MPLPVKPFPNVSAMSLESVKMDIVSTDLDVFQRHKDPAQAIKSLYFNAYSHLIQILGPCCSAIKLIALDVVRTKQVHATEDEVKQAHDLRALFKCLEVDKMWNDLHFLEIAITSLPIDASKEKELALLVWSQYKSYHRIYTKAMSIKKGGSALSFRGKHGGKEKMVVKEITVDKEIDEYTCHDLLDLWTMLLIETL